MITVGPRAAASGVLTTSCTFPPAMRSTASTTPGRESPTLATTAATAIPSASRAAAVPEVATRSNPSDANCRAAPSPAALSRSAREKKTVPSVGRELPAAIWLLAKARPKVDPMPITSPVERISGPRRVSTPGKRLNGRTASLTETWPVTGSVSNPSSRSSPRVAPTMTRAATMATGTPVALATNGTVRLARGLASST